MGLHGDLFAWGDQEVLEENDAKTLRIYEAVKGQLAKSRQWLSEHQLDSPEILEVLKRYEEDWELSIRLLKAGVYTMPGTTACVLFCLSPELDKKVRKAVKAGNLIDIDKTSLESILALWGRLTIRPRGSMRATKFLKFYEELHALLFSAIQGISQMQNQNNLAGFAFLLNTLMFLFKIDKKGGTIKINRFKQIVKAAHNVHGRKFFPKARPMEVYINEDVLLYLIIDACNKLVTHEERDPYSENDREDTLAEVLELSRSEDAVPGERDETKAKDFELCIKFLQEQLPKIFALADEMFAGKRPQGSAVAMPAVAIPDGIGAPPDVADARPGVAAGVTPLDGDGYGEDKDKFRLPGGSAAPPEDDGDVRYDLPGGADAIVPPDHEIGPLEIATFEQLTDIVPIIFMSSKEQEKRRRGWQGEAALARANCEEKATVVAGDFEGTAHINHSFIKEVFIQRRNPEAIVFPSNLICTGTVELKTKGKSYLLNWKIDERGQLTFIIGDKTYNKETFSNGVAKLENLYLESQAIILRQLEILLVRQEHELKARRWGAVLSSEEIGKVKPVTIRGGTEIQPRFEKLVGSVSNGKGKAGPTVTVVGRIAMELLERIKEGQVILEEDANGIILYLRLDEEVEAGKRIEPLYMPCNTIQVLQAVDRGKRSMDEVFVMSSRHRVGRAGYHPHRDTENPRLLIATQRTPDEESEAVKEAVEAHFRVKLTTSVSNTTAITIPKGDEPIEAIVIGTREEIAANNADTILIREIEEWAKGKRDAISQTARDRIQEVIIETETGEKQEVTAEEITHLTQFKIFRVVFNAEQKPQFTIGSYESLADVQKKLVTEESAKVPAAAETASV